MHVCFLLLRRGYAHIPLQTEKKNGGKTSEKIKQLHDKPLTKIIEPYVGVFISFPNKQNSYF